MFTCSRQCAHARISREIARLKIDAATGRVANKIIPKTRNGAKTLRAAGYKWASENISRNNGVLDS
jgi:hypothetical protein